MFYFYFIFIPGQLHTRLYITGLTYFDYMGIMEDRLRYEIGKFAVS